MITHVIMRLRGWIVDPAKLSMTLPDAGKVTVFFVASPHWYFLYAKDEFGRGPNRELSQRDMVGVYLTSKILKLEFARSSDRVAIRDAEERLAVTERELNATRTQLDALGVR